MHGLYFLFSQWRAGEQGNVWTTTQPAGLNQKTKTRRKVQKAGDAIKASACGIALTKLGYVGGWAGGHTRGTREDRWREVGWRLPVNSYGLLPSLGQMWGEGQTWLNCNVSFATTRFWAPNENTAPSTRIGLLAVRGIKGLYFALFCRPQ